MAEKNEIVSNIKINIFFHFSYETKPQQGVCCLTWCWLITLKCLHEMVVYTHLAYHCGRWIAGRVSVTPDIESRPSSSVTPEARRRSPALSWVGCRARIGCTRSRGVRPDFRSWRRSWRWRHAAAGAGSDSSCVWRHHWCRNSARINPLFCTVWLFENEAYFQELDNHSLSLV